MNNEPDLLQPAKIDPVIARVEGGFSINPGGGDPIS
jgi:hypothetical protein